jgi:hypothetical protein
MTQHLHSKRLPIPMARPGAGRVLAAVIGLVAALSLGAIGQAKAAILVGTSAATSASAPASAAADRWTDQPHGFASLAGGTTGGAGGVSGFSWKDARFAEYRNSGPGAGVTADRPQLSDADASTHTVANHLAGNDNWAPYARH